MIRTPTEWLNSDAYKAMAAGGTLASFIEAVQRDVVAAAAERVNEMALVSPVGFTSAQLYRAVEYIRSLIPPKPKETT